MIHTRLTLWKRKFLMRHTVRMVLHYSASRVLDQTICKLYKLNQYVIFSLHNGHSLSTHFVLGETLEYTDSINVIIYFFSYSSVNQVASSLNSCYCYILHNGPAVFTWSGSSTTADDQELVERMLDLIKV